MPRQSFVTEVERYTQRMHSLDGVPAIVALQETLEEVRQNELRRVTSRLSHLTTEELQAVEQMTRSLVHKLQHAPSRPSSAQPRRAIAKP